jgi:SMODS and SLOG-associating 2TM effector domain 1/SMODS and SLOG-associating 2TM effector domain 3
VAGGRRAGIATYLTNQLLSESERQGWTKARALAEGLKSEAHKYIMGAPPYDVPNAAQLLGQKASDLQRVVAGVLPVLISPEERARNLPAASWTIADYTEKRVNEQIERYYEPAIGRHRAAVGRARNVALGAGVLVVFLSAVTTGTTAAGALAGACLGIVTTTAAIIAAWFQSGRHQQLALNYQDAVTKLRRLTATADVTGTQLVVDAEAVFQAEHAAWLAEWQTPSAEARASGTGTGPESGAPAPPLAVAGTRGEAAVTPGS